MLWKLDATRYEAGNFSLPTLNHALRNLLFLQLGKTLVQVSGLFFTQRMVTAPQVKRNRLMAAAT